MAPKGIILALVLVLVAILWNPTAAQSGCTSALTSMASCLNYITGNSSTPSASCCSQLSSVAQSSPQCLCSVLNGGGAPFAININQTLALSLPGACKIQMPPISQCRAAAAPTTSISPVGSPADSSNEKPDAAISPSEAGAKSIPSTDGGSSSNGSNVKAPPHVVLAFLFLVHCASSVNKF